MPMEIELKPLLTKGRVVSVNDTAVKNRYSRPPRGDYRAPAVGLYQ